MYGCRWFLGILRSFWFEIMLKCVYVYVYVYVYVPSITPEQTSPNNKKVVTRKEQRTTEGRIVAGTQIQHETRQHRNNVDDVV